VIYAEVDPGKGVPGYESWWDVPVAEVSTQPDVRAARARWQDGKAKQRR
jgi:3D-(3,5/4)-trihydroxycyclohexane-1,2-dione acylhydrolase (decyclizing)